MCVFYSLHFPDKIGFKKKKKLKITQFLKSKYLIITYPKTFGILSDWHGTPKSDFGFFQNHLSIFANIPHFETKVIVKLSNMSYLMTR